MVRFTPFSVRFDNPGISLIGGALLVIFGIAALLTVERLSDRAQRLDSAEREAANLAGIMMEHTRQSVEAVDQALLGIASTLDVARLGSAATAADTELLLQRRAEAMRGVYQFLLLDAELNVLASSFKLPPEGMNLAASPPLKAFGESDTESLFISSPFIAQFGPAAGKRTLLLVRRLLHADGTLAGYIEAAYSIDWLENFSRSLKFGPEGAVGLVHTDGTIMARSPDGNAYFGRNYTGSEFMKAVATQPTMGLVKSDPTAERAARYTAYRQIPGTPVIAYAAGSLPDILAPWWRGVAIQALGLIIVAVILLVAAVTIRNSMRREATAYSDYAARLERLAAASAAIFSLRDRDAVLKRATDLARELIPSHQAVTSFNIGDSAGAQNIHTVSLSDKYAKWRTYAETPDGSGIYRIITDTNQVMRMTQAALESHPAWKGFGNAKPNHPPMRGWMAAPLKSGAGENFGMIQMSDRNDGEYDAADEAILVQLANVISIALDALRISAQADASAAETVVINTKMTDIVTSMSDGIAVLDRDWRYTMINDQFTAITGLTREDTIGCTVWDVVQKKYPKISHEAQNNPGHLKRCMEQQIQVEFEDSIVTPQGVARRIEVRGFPTGDGITTYIRDITARREAEDRLRQAQKMDAVGQLTGGVAHDFNNLLTVIIGNADVLTEMLPPGPGLRSANLIMGAARRATDLIKRLLAFARRQPLAPCPTKIGELVSDMESLLRRTLNENIDMEIVQAKDLWSANIDPVQLENSLLNLVINARDAMPNGGKLTLETSNGDLEEPYASEADVTPGQYVLLALTDTGEGMSKETLAKAFDPFFTTKEPGKGTGLGLSMVFGYVKQSGGHVRIYSEVGIGTTVKLFLPRSKEESVAAAAETTPKVAPRGSETVLMVEDEDMVREFVAATLNELGYKVTACASGDEALAALDAGLKPAILLTDVVLAGLMNGKQLSDRVKQRFPTIAVLYMSGYTEDAIVHQGRLDPGVQLISKPFRRQQLAEKLRKVVDLNIAA